MFRFFETRVDPFPAPEPTQPPSGLTAFCWHYTRPVSTWIVAMGLLSALIAIGEVALYGFLGSLVDWLSNTGRDDFMAREGGRLLWLAGLLLVLLPLAVVLQALIIHQTLLGNYPMIGRWQMHRCSRRRSGCPGTLCRTTALPEAATRPLSWLL